MRKMIAEDLWYDPTHKRQLQLAGHLLGHVLNLLNEPDPDVRKRHRDQALEIALEHGIVAFDNFHHAPRCPANHWCRTKVPSGPCNCGAKKYNLLSNEGRRR